MGRRLLMAPERSATGNDAVLCPLPAPLLAVEGRGEVGEGRLVGMFL